MKGGITIGRAFLTVAAAAISLGADTEPIF